MLDTDRIWDEWRAARANEPDLAPEDFASRYGSDAAELLEYLEQVLALESAVPSAPLVDLTRHADEMDARFANGSLSTGCSSV